MRRCVATCVALAWVSACGGGETTTKPPDPGPKNGGTDPVIPAAPPPDDSPAWLTDTPEDLPEEIWVRAVAVAQDPGATKTAGEAALAVAIYGPAETRRWSDLPAPFVPTEDAVKQADLSDGRVAMLLAVQRTKFAERMQGWIDSPPAAGSYDASTPQGALAAALYFVDYQERQGFGCERLRAIASSDCEPPDMTVANRQLEKVGKSLQLLPAFSAGIPFREGKTPLRPATARALWKPAGGEPVPWKGLALRFEADEGVLVASSAQTDRQGRAVVQFSAAPQRDAKVRAVLDREALLGPHADHWPEMAVEMSLRDLGEAKPFVAVSIRDYVLNKAAAANSTANSVVAGLVERRHAKPHLLPEDLATFLHRDGADIGAALRALADEAGGAVDVVVFGVAHSEFASRMGARSVWHEASGQIQIYDAWSGKEIAKLERITKAVGIGDQNAASKALKELGHQLADAVDEALRGGSSMRANATTRTAAR